MPRQEHCQKGEGIVPRSCTGADLKGRVAGVEPELCYVTRRQDDRLVRAVPLSFLQLACMSRDGNHQIDTAVKEKS